MKHIFVVHSPVTYLCSIGVINKEKIQHDDVLIISDGYNMDGPFPIMAVTVTFSQDMLFRNPKKFIRLFNDPSYYLYKLIEQFVGDDKFMAYVPVFHLIKRLVVIHPKCSGFHFIEEGMAAYYDDFSIEDYAYSPYGDWKYYIGFKGFRQRIWAMICAFSYRIDKMACIPLFYLPYVFNRDRKFYGFSIYSHRFASNNILLDFKEVKNSFEFEHSYSLHNETIWIGDPDIILIYSKEEYVKSLKEKLYPFLHKIKCKILYVRFHQREDEKQRSLFLNLLQEINIQYAVIPDEKIMEFVFMESTNCNVVSYMSSLLFYASFFGHNSYSIMRGIPELYNNVNTKISYFEKIVDVI